ncbi:MAG: hypothetical protein CV087_21085 [Candidatus Brocadia sp. WS118]|nr:MAG: hypothetical protein CV087_21085 [Candidatus Brocadia sp. WS118]
MSKTDEDELERIEHILKYRLNKDGMDPWETLKDKSKFSEQKPQPPSLLDQKPQLPRRKPRPQPPQHKPRPQLPQFRPKPPPPQLLPKPQPHQLPAVTGKPSWEDTVRDLCRRYIVTRKSLLIIEVKDLWWDGWGPEWFRELLKEIDLKYLECETSQNIAKRIFEIIFKRKAELEKQYQDELKQWEMKNAALKKQYQDELEELERKAEKQYQDELKQWEIKNTALEKQYQDELAELERQYQDELKQWGVKNAEFQRQYQNKVEQWEAAKQSFLKKQKEKNDPIDKRKRPYLSKTPDAIIDYCKLVLLKSKYPDYFPK